MKFIPRLRRLLFPLMLLLGVSPLLLLLLSYVCAIPPLGAWLFPCVCVLLTTLCLFLPGRLRPVILVLCALSALFVPDGDPVLRLLALGTPLLCLAALPLAGRDVHGISPFFYVVGIGSQLLTQFLLRIGTADGLPSVVAGPANTLFVLYLILLLLSLNRISTDNAALSRYRLPAGVRRVNTLLTLAFTAIALLLAFSPSIVQGIHAGLRALRHAIFALGAWIMSLLYTPEDPGFVSGAPAASAAPQAAAVQPPSQLAIIMEHIATVIAAVVVIAGLLVLARLLILLVIRTLNRLVRHLHRFSAAATEDYVDEITDTRGEDGERQSTLLRRRRMSSYPDTPQGTVRRHYAHLLRSHPHWQAGSTARENLAADPAAIYERARYSSHPVTREDADAFVRSSHPLSDHRK